jgi:hypothetical protein
MQWEELNALVKDFGREKVDEMLDRLNENSKTHPKKFKELWLSATVIEFGFEEISNIHKNPHQNFKKI